MHVVYAPRPELLGLQWRPLWGVALGTTVCICARSED
jgi:hypothetical protein